MINTIKKQFIEVIKYSQDYYHFDLDIDPLFDKWYEAKKDFIEKFGGLIYECPEQISFDLPEREKEKRFIDFVSSCAYFPMLQLFLMKEKNNFFDNIVREDHENIPKGMKISRALKFFIEDKERLDKLQTEMSTILQEVRVTGTLCFSVHPLDFLSASENTYKWRSCHALDGEYRSGNLSYMVDSSTIICYLKGDKEAILPRFPENVPWNNKKWRMLLFFSDERNMIFAGRQYPFFNEKILSDIYKQLKKIKLMKQGFFDWIPFQKDAVTSCGDLDLADRYLPIKRKLFSIHDIVNDKEHSLHFNDLLYSSCYEPYYTLQEGWFSDDYKVFIGGAVPCLKCGRDHIWLSSNMLCKECELEYGTSTNDTYAYCERCGRRMLVEESLEVDGQDICADCIKNECFVCDYCDEIHLNESKHYIEEQDIYVCEECEISYFREQGE